MKTLKTGDAVEVVADDHTSKNSEGWSSVRDIAKITPLQIKVVGYYINQNKRSWKIAMAYCDGSYSTFWIIPKNRVTEFKVLKKASKR